MARRFKKNNYIVESDSDEDIGFNSRNSASSNETSDSDSSESFPSYNSDDSEHSSLKNSSSNNDISSDLTEVSSSTSLKNSSRDGSDNLSLVSQRENKRSSTFDRFSKNSPISEKVSVVESSLNCGVDEVLAKDSSASVINETVSDSDIHVSKALLKETENSAGEEEIHIVEESSDSEESIEYIDSFKSINLKSSTKLHITEDHSIDETSAIVEIGSSPSYNSFQKSSPEIDTKSVLSDSPSHSEISDASHSSVQSTSSLDERKILERQLAEKRTAYQNILRAVKCCDLKKLRDGGKLLQDKLEFCKKEVDDLKEKLKSITNGTGDSSIEKYSVKTNTLFSTSDQVTTNLGKKGLETHRVQTALTVDALVTLHNSLETCPADNELENDPKGLRVELMAHQKYALSWLLWREKQNPPGGILADDMGLGKTLTMIALVLRSEEYKKQKNIEENTDPLIIDGVRSKTLVVCPSSLIGQWQGQIKQHCKSQILTSLVHHGKPRELQAKKLAAYDIVITSYGVITEENKIVKGDRKGALFRVLWTRVILDEAHVIRNHKTKKAQALCELEAKYRWCLTGTPVQNKELDMYSLLKFLRCSPFDNLTVWKRWVDNKSANGVQRLNTVVKSILLRRTKEELKSIGELTDLPVKTLVPVYINLNKEEEAVYHTVLQFSKSLLAEFILQEQKKLGFVSDEIKSKHHRILNSANEIKTTEIFVLLLRLRQICCLPGLIHSMLEKDSCAEDGIDVEDDPILQDLTSQMKRMSVGIPNFASEDFEKKKKILVDSNPVFEIDRASMKIQAVINIVKESLEAEDKIVVVSQWANLLQKLKVHLVPLNIDFVVLDGSVPVKFRPRIIDDFNDPNTSVKVMLLSLTAGGVGLNLIGGNRLIIVEPHWNPQLESQACDRIYRVGQKKQVFIYKIICKNTIEERIELLQKKKLEVADTILKGELKLNRNKITLADLKILFDVK